MLELFRRNHAFFTMLLLVYAFLLRLPMQFVGPVEDVMGKGILTVWLLDVIPTHGLTSHIIATFLIFLHVVMLNRIVIRHRLTDEMTLYPGLFYILFVSLFPPMISLHALLVANTFVILGLADLFVSHKKQATAERIFNIGFWFCIASLCYFGFSILFLFGLIGLSIQRTVRSREWLQYLIGFITPLLIFAMVDYLLHDQLLGIREHLSFLAFLDFKVAWEIPFIMQVVIYGFFVLLAILNYGTYTARKNIHAQKKIDILYWFILFAMVAVSLQEGVTQAEWIVLAIPFSVFMSIQFLNIKSNWFAEALHFVILTYCLGMQFWALL